MTIRRDFLVLAALIAAATPTLAQTAAPSVAPAAEAASVAQGASSIPDLAGIWWHPSLPGLEPPASGPGPVTNRSRSRFLQQSNISNYDQLVGDYTNPILNPQAADTVKKFGEISLAGITYPSPANQCWPEPVPYIFKNFAMQIFQHPDRLTIIYEQDHEVRQIRLNASHPAQVKPSWYGDAVAHYEGDTLVIDTVGTKTDRPFAMIDLYGTPYTKALHTVERYRLIPYEEARDGLARDAKENRQIPGDLDRNYKGKYLQMKLTVEDGGVFTTPWTATVTFGRGTNDWPETVCAENRHEYYNRKESEVPTAAKADF